jgi:hypothetical protein
MASLEQQLHNLIASLTVAARKGDAAAVAKWARKIALVVNPTPMMSTVVVIPPVVAPPSGLTNWSAAQIDAGFVAQASIGNLGGADTNPAPGAAKALGFSGVVGDGSLYFTFVDGGLTATSGINPGAGPGGFTTPFGLAPGIHPDDPYTGPGAERP